MTLTARLAGCLPLVLLASFIAGCSSGGYKTQGYARLSNSKDFEHEYPIVWKAIVSALGEYKIESKDQEKGVIKTDWIYNTSNEKYVEYQVNGFPRKRFLQTRYKFDIKAQKEIGGVKVTVSPDEEVENLKSDGSFDGWKSSSDADASKANDMLKNIELKILARPE